MTTLTTEEKAQLFTHLATMENAGIPALQSFQQLRLKPVYMEGVVNCRRAISKGSDIANAAYGAKLFNYFEFTLIRAACAAGSPGLSYKRLAQVYKEKTALEKRLRSRMRLPLLMLILALSVLRLPALITGSISLVQFMLGIIVPMLLLFFVVNYFKKRLQESQHKPSRNTSKDEGFDRVLLQLPILGRMILRDNARQYYEALSLLLEAGVPMFEATPLATQTIWNRTIQPHFHAMTKQLEQGWTLSQTLESNLMRGDDAVVELVRTGEVSGTLPAMLWRHVEAETKAQTQFREELAAWLPKIIYGMVAVYIIIQIFKSGAFMPQLPDEAR